MIAFVKSLFGIKPAVPTPKMPVFPVETAKPKVEVNKKPLVKKANVVAKKTTKKTTASKK